MGCCSHSPYKASTSVCYRQTTDQKVRTCIHHKIVTVFPHARIQTSKDLLQDKAKLHHYYLLTFWSFYIIVQSTSTILTVITIAFLTVKTLTIPKIRQLTLRTLKSQFILISTRSQHQILFIKRTHKHTTLLIRLLHPMVAQNLSLLRTIVTNDKISHIVIILPLIKYSTFNTNKMQLTLLPFPLTNTAIP